MCTQLFLTPSHLAIVMEYADGRDLEILIRKEGRLIEQMARWIFQQLIIALDFSHHVVGTLLLLRTTLAMA
jgi:serine/threonine-protein kinase SRK2